VSPSAGRDLIFKKVAFWSAKACILSRWMDATLPAVSLAYNLILACWLAPKESKEVMMRETTPYMTK
jgi:hypothetical protein